jgi:hypothetical protein
MSTVDSTSSPRADSTSSPQADIGLIGLAVLGENLILKHGKQGLYGGLF